jgi:uncharacterized FlgJ-related protein
MNKKKWIFLTVVFLIVIIFPSFNHTVNDDHVAVAKDKNIEQENISIVFGEVDNNEDFVKFISNCVDKIPESHNLETHIPLELVVAQAVHESSWGNSRFAKEGNNLFGIRTWNNERKQLKPLEIPNAVWGIIIFDKQCESIEYYYKLINSHNAYMSFRESRKIMIESGQKLDGLVLATFLSMFSELGLEYADRLKKTIIQLREEYPWLQQY